MISTTTFAQEGAQLKPTKQQPKILKAQNKKGEKIQRNELTPAQKKALKEKKLKQQQLNDKQKRQRSEALTKAKKLKPVKASSPNGKLEKLTPRKGTPITKMAAKDRKKDIAKAKAIAKVNKGRGRVAAGNEKLAKASAQLEIMKKSGKYTTAQIKQKELILAKYKQNLLRLKGSVQQGDAKMKN